MSDKHSRSSLILGKRAHQKLARKAVTIVGLGAIGSSCAEILARQGVGTLIGIDCDPAIESHNLDRQLVYRENQVGKPKAIALAEGLHEVNADVAVHGYFGEFAQATKSSFRELVENSDVLVSAVDNGLARYSVAVFSLVYAIPHLDGATGGFNCRAYIMPSPRRGPCLICTFSRKDFQEISSVFSCTRHNDSSPAPAIAQTGVQIGNVLAMETLKLLLGLGVKYNEIRINLLDWIVGTDIIDASESHKEGHIWG